MNLTTPRQEEDVLQRARRSTAMRTLTQAENIGCHFCEVPATLKVGEEAFCQAHAAPVLAQAIKHSVFYGRH